MPAANKKEKKKEAIEKVDSIAAVVKAPKRGALSTTMEDLHLMSQAVFKSGYFPEIKSAAQGFLRMKVGMELGLPEMASLRAIHYLEEQRDFVIETSVLAAMAMEKGIRWKKITPPEKRKTECELEIYKPGSDELPIRVKFTEEDAKRAGLLHKKNWQMYPERMFFKRALKFGLNEFDPRLDMGYYTREELEDVVPFSEKEEDIQDAEVIEEDKAEDETKEDQGQTEREPGQDDERDEVQSEEGATIDSKVKIFESQISAIKEYFDGYGNGIARDLKSFLFDNQTDRIFVAKNEHQKLSLHCGKMEDIDFLYENREKFWKFYIEDREKVAKAGGPVPPSTLRYFKTKKEE